MVTNFDVFIKASDIYFVLYIIQKSIQEKPKLLK